MVAQVNLWNKVVGYVLWDDQRGLATFEFDPGFARNELDISPITMPLKEIRNGKRIYSFPGLEKDTFLGLPGLLADALPDRFGNRMMEAWFARHGRSLNSIDPVERLCYTGKRAMGALEFEPVLSPEKDLTTSLEIQEMVNMVNNILAERSTLNSNIISDGEGTLMSIIRLGTSAGGARPKAVIAYDEKSGEIRSGHIPVPDNFSQWIIKLDGISDNRLGESKGFGHIEYAYYLMAKDCDINMSPCLLMEENGRAHFMAKRFDRIGNNEKLHLQSLCGIAHYDYNNPDAFSYEQAFQVMRKMLLPYTDAEQLFRRMVFNIIANNNDDHTKNISFIMDSVGNWSLSPAYDMMYAYDPGSFWLRRHQMSVNGKRSEMTRNDFLSVAREMNIKSAAQIIDEILQHVSQWEQYAKEAGIDDKTVKAVQITFDLKRYF